MSLENEESTQNRILEQKSFQRDKYLGCPLCKILMAIRKVEEGWTSTNVSEN